MRPRTAIQMAFAGGLASLHLTVSAQAPAAPTEVIVTNPRTEPVPVTPVTRDPVEMAGYASATGNYGGSCIIPLIKVPAERRLVVEQVSGYAQQSSAAAVGASAYLSNGFVVQNALTSQTIGMTHFLEARQRPGTDVVEVSQQVRILVRTGKDLELVWNLPSYKAGSTCWAWVSGYYERVK